MTAVATHLPEGMLHLGDESLEVCWAAMEALQQGQTVSLVGRGVSMEPIIPDGTRLILEPVTDARTQVKTGDAVFCLVNHGFAIHKVWGSRFGRRAFLIGGTYGDPDNLYFVDGWAWAKHIYGRYIGAV